MKHPLALLLTCLSCLSLPVTPKASAASGAPMLPLPEGERFLFIVDTSSGMEKLKEQNETTLYELLRTGLFGQMQTGDTFGLWTYDKETHAGRFPMQVWEMRRASQLGTIAAAYLSGQNYENSDDVKQMIQMLAPVIRIARNLNVLIISDGSSAIRGTPFDKAINAEFKKQRRVRSAAKQPFVTTLFARDGSITNFSVVVAGQPILLPERQAPELAVAPKAAAPTNRPPGVLISVTPATPGSATVVSTTNMQNHSTPVSAPAGGASIAQSPMNAVAKSATGTPRVIQIVTRSNHIPSEIEPSTPEPARTAATLVAEVTQTNNPAPEPSAAAPVPPAPTDAASSPVAEIPVMRSALAAILPEPITVAAREPHPEPGTANPAPSAAVQAAALPMPSGPGAGLFLTFGSLLMAAAFFLLFVVFRRLRPPAGGSLITQSMERR